MRQAEKNATWAWRVFILHKHQIPKTVLTTIKLRIDVLLFFSIVVGFEKINKMNKFHVQPELNYACIESSCMLHVRSFYTYKLRTWLCKRYSINLYHNS